MILAATLLWSIEVILAKHLLGKLDTRMLAAARMGLGTVVLVGWLAVSGRGGDLLALGSEQWMWAIATGLLLTAYVATWYAALARAQAVDVTAVLVFGAVVTALIARRGRRSGRRPGRHRPRHRRRSARGTRRRLEAGATGSRPHDRRAPPVRAVRVPAELARILRCRRDPHTARVRRRRHVRRRARRARANLRGGLAVPHAHRRREPDRRSARPSRSRRPTGSGTSFSTASGRVRLHATSTSASADASAARRNISSTRSRPAPSLTIRSTSSPCTRGSGLLRTGIVDEPLHVLDQCRITPARVLSVAGDEAVTRLRPLRWNGTELELGSWTSRTVRWRADGLSLVAPQSGRLGVSPLGLRVRPPDTRGGGRARPHDEASPSGGQWVSVGGSRTGLDPRPRKPGVAPSALP